MAGLLIVAMHEQAPPWQRTLWTLSLVAGLCALLVNTSRGSGFVAVVLVGLWIAWLFRAKSRANGNKLNRLALLGRALAVVGLAILLAMAIGIDRTLERWSGFDRELHAGNARWQAGVTSIQIIGDAGVMGFGPGTFVRVYPLYRNDPRTRLEHAHNDYLQTLIEWGFLGAAAWAIALLAGPLLAGWAWAQGRGPRRTRDRMLAFGGFSALVGLSLHALVDYPFQVGSIQLYAVVLVGLFWAFPHWHEKPAPVPIQTALGTLGDWMERQPSLCPATEEPHHRRSHNRHSRKRTESVPSESHSDEHPSVEVTRPDPALARAPVTSRSICVVFNPAARGDKARYFRQHLANLGADCVLQPTKAPGAGRILAAEAVRDGFSCIVAAGGDGTLNEVLNGIADERGAFDHVSLGVLPLGTSNVFARELGLPLRWDLAWDIIRQGNERRIDLVQAVFETPDGGRARHFVQLAGAGLDARAVELVNWEWKKQAGFFAYVTAALRALREPQSQITLQTATGTSTGELVLIGNGQRYGGPFRLFPQASLEDGQLDAHVYRRADLRLAFICLVGLCTGRLGQVGQPHRIRAASLRLTASVRTPLQVDGELVGYLPARLDVCPAALRVVVPSRALPDQPR
jgi:diacylglycerol kinase (ATP)